MQYWVQYHKFDELGYLPGGDEPETAELASIDTSDFGVSCVTTRKKTVLKSVGDVIFLIMGYGTNPKTYVLWSWITVQKTYEEEDGQYEACGSGAVLKPLPILKGNDFAGFQKSNGNFGLGFKNITDLPYCTELIELAKKNAGDRATSKIS